MSSILVIHKSLEAALQRKGTRMVTVTIQKPDGHANQKTRTYLTGFFL